MKKKIIAAMLTGAMVLSMTACGKSGDTASTTGADNGAASAEDAGESQAQQAPAADASGSVELVVTTTFAGEDSNAQNYKDAVKAWEAETGNVVIGTSARRIKPL